MAVSLIAQWGLVRWRTQQAVRWGHTMEGEGWDAQRWSHSAAPLIAESDKYKSGVAYYEDSASIASSNLALLCLNIYSGKWYNPPFNHMIEVVMPGGRPKKPFSKISALLRFYSHLPTTLGNECWNWPKSKTRGNYGCFFMDGKLHRAHRASYILRHGPIPDGLHCLHHCDNPLCVNPDHLFLGSNADNAVDMARKGRANPLPGNNVAVARKLARTTCGKGHPYTKDSLLLEQTGKGNTIRRCRICRRIRERA